MKSPAKFSVVIPNYNHGHLLGKCLEAIRMQDYDDYEVWICDNVSTDNSLEVAREYTEKDERFHLAINPSHHPSSAFGINDALYKNTTGDISLWVNSDDYLNPGYFSEVEHHFDNPNVSYVRIAMSVYLEIKPDIPFIKFPEPWFRAIDILNYNTIFPASPFRSYIFKQVGGFDIKARFWDWDFWIRVAIGGYKGADCIIPLVTRTIHNTKEPNADTGELKTVDYAQQNEGVTYIMNKYLAIRTTMEENYAIHNSGT